MPRGRHRHSPPLHRLLPPSVIAGVSVVCAAGAWIPAEPVVIRGFAAGAALAAVVGSVVMRSWDRMAGRRVADLTRARASDEWRHEERVAELEGDVDESRELRAKLEQKLRVKRTELAGLRNEHAALLRRYATAETERASALEGRRLLAIETTAPAKALPAVARVAGAATPSMYMRANLALDRLQRDAELAAAAARAIAGAGAAAAARRPPKGDGPGPGSAPADGEGPAARDTGASAGSDTAQAADEGAGEGTGPAVAADEPDATGAAGAENATSAVNAEEAEDTEDTEDAENTADGAGAADEAAPSATGGDTGTGGGTGSRARTGKAGQASKTRQASKTGQTRKTGQSGRSASGARSAASGKARKTGGRTGQHAKPAETVKPAERPKSGGPEGTGETALPGAQDAREASGGHGRAAATTRGTGHFTVPTAAAVVWPTEERRRSPEGRFDFFGASAEDGVAHDGADASAIEAVQNEDLADVVGEEALALHKAEAESGFRPAGEAERGVGQVIDLTAHDETEQIDVAELRDAVS